MELVRSKKTGDTLTIYLKGEIDHCMAEPMRRRIEELIRSEEIKHLRIDFSGVSFMDSSGVGMIIGRYKTMKAKKGSVSAYGMSAIVEKLFRISGLHRIIRIEEERGEKNA